MSQDVTPTDLTPAAGLPILPPGGIVLPADALPISMRGRKHRVRTFPSDAVEFYARCPGCGVTATWRERREDTHTEIEVDCRICARRDRMRLAQSA